MPGRDGYDHGGGDHLDIPIPILQRKRGPSWTAEAATESGRTTRYNHTLRGELFQVSGPATSPIWYEYDNKGRLSIMYTMRSGAPGDD